MFWKKHLPALIAFLTGMVFALQFYVPHQVSQDLLLRAAKWMTIIASFVLVLGVISVTQVHWSKVRRMEGGWGFSAVFFFALVAMVVTGALAGGDAREAATRARTSYGFLYEFFWEPLSGTMFATLAFYVASAAFRAFRAKTFAAALLLVFAVIFLFGKVPLGETLWAGWWGQTTLWGWEVGKLGTTIEWLMNHVNAPGRRAIIMGVALGMIATCLKVIFGIERTYLGGKAD